MAIEKGAPPPWKQSQGPPSPSPSGGTVGGSVPNHFHDATAIISGRFEDERLPERIGAQPPYYGDLNDSVRTGQWWANDSTANAPVAASFWCGQTIAYDLDDGFTAQVAYEINSGQRMYRRVQLFGVWQSWIAVT